MCGCNSSNVPWLLGRPTQLLSLNRRREALHPRWNKILFGFGARHPRRPPLSLSVGARVKRREEGGSLLVWRSHNLTKCGAGFFVPRYRSERAAGGNSSKSPFIVGPFVLPLPSICRRNEAQEREREMPSPSSASTVRCHFVSVKRLPSLISFRAGEF